MPKKNIENKTRYAIVHSSVGKYFGEVSESVLKPTYKGDIKMDSAYEISPGMDAPTIAMGYLRGELTEENEDLMIMKNQVGTIKAAKDVVEHLEWYQKNLPKAKKRAMVDLTLKSLDDLLTKDYR